MLLRITEISMSAAAKGGAKGTRKAAFRLYYVTLDVCVLERAMEE